MSGPRNINPYFEEAQKFVLSLGQSLGIRVAILDDWHSGDKQGARIIYDSCLVDDCHSDCSRCLLWRLFGEDKARDSGIRLWTSLCVATQQHHDLFPSKQKFLNCKTFEQYQEAFVRFTVVACLQEQELIDEIDWINGFRLLVYHGITNIAQLREIEKVEKQKMMTEVLNRLTLMNDFKRKSIARNHAIKIGLLEE